MKIRALDHSALLVRDIERSRQFYGQVLGMEEVPRPHNFDFPGAWFRMGETELHLIGETEAGRVASVEPNSYRPDELARGYGTHSAYEVDDIEEAQRHLREHNIAIVGGPRPRGDGIIQLYILDPDNYVVELFVR